MPPVSPDEITIILRGRIYRLVPVPDAAPMFVAPSDPDRLEGPLPGFRAAAEAALADLTDAEIDEAAAYAAVEDHLPDDSDMDRDDFPPVREAVLRDHRRGTAGKGA
jgi:hypothetical protein